MLADQRLQVTGKRGEFIMYNNQTFLAIIPARSGSKGIFNKNIKMMNHKPLMAHTIEACRKASIFDEIIVSTDSMDYAKIAQDYGASVPFLRPTELATDEATTIDVILHVLKEMSDLGKTFEYFMLLQPTSPLRNETHILESAKLLFEKNADSVISICKLEHPTNLNVKFHNNGYLDVPYQDKKMVRRQEISQEYRINGAIYLTNTAFFLNNNNFYSGKTYPFLMDALNSIDIDEEFQFSIAEYIIKCG